MGDKGNRVGFMTGPLELDTIGFGGHSTFLAQPILHYLKPGHMKRLEAAMQIL